MPTDTPEDLLQQDWTGDCYRAAVKWVSTAEEDDWLVVHGTVMSHTLGKRIEHAWCERGNFVVDLALPIGERIIDRERYYGAAKPEIRKRYSSDEAILLSIKNKHSGPWEDSQQLQG